MEHLLNERRRAGKHQTAVPRLQSLLECHERANPEAREVADTGYVDHPVDRVRVERQHLRVKCDGACSIEATVERHNREAGFERDADVHETAK